MSNLEFFFKIYPPITSKFVVQSLTMSYKSYVKEKIYFKNFAFFLYKSCVSFFTLLGLFYFLLQIKQETCLSEKQISLILAIVILTGIIFSSDSFIKLVSFLLYWCFILNIPYTYFLLQDSNLWMFYIYLYIVIAFIRPLGNFVVESFFFFLVKRYYKYNFFKKILVCMAPSYSPGG